MISSLVPKLVLCGLLILTLSFKVSDGMSQSMSGQQEDVVREHIAAFLARHGFQPNPAIAIQYLTGVSGRSGGCQLLIAEAAFQGWHRDSLRRLASREDQLFFFFRGHKYQDQPVWLTRGLPEYFPSEPRIECTSRADFGNRRIAPV
jgi:hypothetical protein